MEERKSRKYFIGIIVLLLICVVGGLMLFMARVPVNPGAPASPIEYETATDGTNKTSVAAITTKINEMVEEGMIRISINPTPEFESGSAEGTVNIVNHSSNLFPQVVEIILDETGESVYKSKAIPVGQGVERITLSLDSPLSAGTYDCTAYFTAINPDTAVPVGTAGAKLKLRIANNGGDNIED